MTRLLVTKQYAKSEQTAGVPHEAIAYDAQSGTPLAAFRNLGDRSEPSSGSSSFGGRDCDIVPIVTQDHVVVLATPSRSGSVRWGSQPYADAGVPVALESTDAKTSIMLSPRFAATDTVGLSDAEGAIVRLDAAMGTVSAADGESQRYWLDGVAGHELVLRDVSGTKHAIFDGETWSAWPHEGSHVLGDGVRFAWLVSSPEGVEVWTVLRDTASFTDDATLIATITGAKRVVAVTLADSKLVVQASEQDLGSNGNDSLFMIDLGSGKVSSRRLSSESDALLLANDATYAWVGTSDYLSYSNEERPTQFERLERLDMSQSCRGTPLGCQALDVLSCRELPACSIATERCSGTPTLQCDHTEASPCLTARGCDWDFDTELCAPAPCSAGVFQSDCEAMGCSYAECEAASCASLSSSECAAQPGCDWEG